MAESAPLPASTPEAQGMPSDAILAFVDAADRDIRDLHSFILLRHGERRRRGLLGARTARRTRTCSSR